jgi:hypothetical protein
MLTNFALSSPDKLSPLRAIHSLREKDVAVFGTMMSRWPKTWSMDRHEGYEGYLTVILTPRDGSSANYVVSRTVDGWHLSANHDDDYQTLGCFGSLEELVAVMWASIASEQPPPARAEGDDQAIASTKARASDAPTVCATMGVLAGSRSA